MEPYDDCQGFSAGSYLFLDLNDYRSKKIPEHYPLNWARANNVEDPTKQQFDYESECRHLSSRLFNRAIFFLAESGSLAVLYLNAGSLPFGPIVWVSLYLALSSALAINAISLGDLWRIVNALKPPESWRRYCHDLAVFMVEFGIRDFRDLRDESTTRSRVYDHLKDLAFQIHAKRSHGFRCDAETEQICFNAKHKAALKFGFVNSDPRAYFPEERHASWHRHHRN